MQVLRSILYWLDGKKLHIANAIGIVSSFFASRGVIQVDTLALIVQLLGLITSGAQIATIQLGASRKR